MTPKTGIPASVLPRCGPKLPLETSERGRTLAAAGNSCEDAASAMPPTLRAPHPSAVRDRRFTRWDALVAVALGLGLVAAGWADLRAYRPRNGRPQATFGLIDKPGDTRLGEDEFFQRGAIIVHLQNVGAPEHNDRGPFRHVLGPTVTIESWSTLSFEQVDFDFANDFPSQDLTVAHNGQVLEQIHLTPGRVARSYRVPLHPGSNQFTLTFAVYNHHGVEFDNGETRPLAGAFRLLNVHF